MADRPRQRDLDLRADPPGPDPIARARLTAEVQRAAVELQLADWGRADPRADLPACRAVLTWAARDGVTPDWRSAERAARERLQRGPRSR